MLGQSIIIEGPAGCGKTRNAEKLRVHYGLGRVYDTGLDPSEPLRSIPTHGVLVLTIEPLNVPGIQVIQYADAAKAAGLT
jgi:hypothetical protein